MTGLTGHCRKHTLEIRKKSLEILPASIKIIYVAMHRFNHNSKNKLNCKKTEIMNSSKRI
jgi:hypothetical protein